MAIIDTSNSLSRAAIAFRHHCWFVKKKWQTETRTHLSHVLAGLLAILVAIREGREILPLILEGKYPDPFGWLIIVVIVLTFVAALWEFRGNKLTASTQELRFLFGMRTLLGGLEKLAKAESNQIERKFNEFLESFLEIASDTFAMSSKVDAGIMVKDPEKESLRLVKSSKGARYPEDLEIPLPVQEDTSNSGPAGVAFKSLNIVYVPKKNRKEAWELVRSRDDREPDAYESTLESPHHCWINAPQPHLEDFRSVLCIPVAVYGGEDQKTMKTKKTRFGVLNFSTSMRDTFVPRDFAMSECFASVLGQAFAIARRKKTTN
jgi:hypothetical protein